MIQNEEGLTGAKNAPVSPSWAPRALFRWVGDVGVRTRHATVGDHIAPLVVKRCALPRGDHAWAYFGDIPQEHRRGMRPLRPGRVSAAFELSGSELKEGGRTLCQHRGGPAFNTG